MLERVNAATERRDELSTYTLSTYVISLRIKVRMTEELIDKA